MKNQIHYQWAVEELDHHDDIIDSTHFDTIEDALEYAGKPDDYIQVVLIRSVGNDAEGVIDRAWAYTLRYGPVLGLRDNFSYGENERGEQITGPQVPKRYHAELARAQRKV